MRPFVSLCFAAIQRIWSSKMKHAESKGTRLVKEPDDNGRWIVIWRQRESSLSPVTSISCRKPTNLATPQPSRRVSGSTRINWITSMTRKRRIFEPSLLATVHAIRSLLLRSNTLLTWTQVWGLVNGSCVSGSIANNRESPRIKKNTRIARRALSTSPQGNRLLNSMPVIGVPVGGSRMLESIINHSTLRGRFCISLYSSSNMSRNISSLL